MAGGGPQVHIFPPIQTTKGDFDEEKVWEMVRAGLVAELEPDSNATINRQAFPGEQMRSIRKEQKHLLEKSFSLSLQICLQVC